MCPAEWEQVDLHTRREAQRMNTPPTRHTTSTSSARQQTPPPPSPRLAPVAASRPSGSGRRPRWPAFGMFLLAMGALGIGLGIAAGYLPVTQLPTQLKGAVPAVQDWAHLIGVWLVGAGTGILVLGVTWRGLRRRRRQLRARVIAVASAATRVPVDRLTLRRARWARRGQGLRSGVVRYRPADAVVSDSAEALAAALAPHSAGVVVARWDPRRSRFLVTPKPAVPLRLEERSAALGKLVEALTHIVGALAVDQRRSAVGGDGSVQQLVARYAHTTRDIGDGFRQRVQAVLDAKAPSPTGYWTVRWDPAANEVTVAPSQPLPRKAPYPLEMPGRGEQMLIPLGVGDGGQVVCWQPTLFPHLLAVGPTGTGKTVFLFGLIISCLMRGWVIVLLDPKELSFRGFDPGALVGRGFVPWGGIVSVATTEADMEQGIAYFHQNMRNRYSAIKGFEISEDDLPPVLMIVDEAGELVERLNEYHTSEEKLEDLQEQAAARGVDPKNVAKPKGVKNPELRKVWSGLRLGRQARNFVVTATQRPDVSFIPGEARSNLTTRVGLGHLDGSALEMVFNTRAIQQRVYDYVVDPVTGQRQRQRVRGRATVDVGNGPQTIQTYFVPDPAKYVTGELNAEESAIIARLHELVQASRQRWEGQVEATTAGGRKRAAVLREFDEEIVLAVDAADQEAQTGQTDGEFGELDAVPAHRLEIGQTVLVEVDCVGTMVLLEEIEDDPFQADDLQITYRIVGDGDHAGEMGVTSIGREEQIPVAG